MLDIDGWGSFCLLSIAFALVAAAFFLRRPRRPLPPGASPMSILLALLLSLGRSNFQIEPALRRLRRRHGPVFRLLLPSRTTVFVADPDIAHAALVQLGSATADRPAAAGTVFSRGSISSRNYGPAWRTLRHNLMSGVLHPLRLRACAPIRRGALADLISRFEEDGGADAVVLLQHALYRVVLYMCFGRDLEDAVADEIESVQRELATAAIGFQIFTMLPAVTKIVFRKRWRRMLSLRRRQVAAMVPLIRAARQARQKGEVGWSYVDSLVGLTVPEDGGGGSGGGCLELSDDEIVNLCSEFILGSAESTAAALEWTIANLVKQPEVQRKLRDEITAVVLGTPTST